MLKNSYLQKSLLTSEKSVSIQESLQKTIDRQQFELIKQYQNVQQQKQDQLLKSLRQIEIQKVDAMSTQNEQNVILDKQNQQYQNTKQICIIIIVLLVICAVANIARKKQ